jgi:hypothetical protein
MTMRIATTMTEHATTLADDLLVGADAIAGFTGWSRRRVFYLIEQGQLPHFKVGGRLHAKKSSILAWIAELESQSCGTP